MSTGFGNNRYSFLARPTEEGLERGDDVNNQVIKPLKKYELNIEAMLKVSKNPANEKALETLQTCRETITHILNENTLNKGFSF